MSVLVTGGAGYIGSHMVLRLLGDGEQTIVLDNLATGHRWAVADGATFIVGDIGDKELTSRIVREHGVDAIIHFAGSTSVPESVTDPLAYYENNTVKSRSLIEVAVEAGVKHFIFSSTAAIYGHTKENPVTEDALLAPISPYGTSKMMTELMLRDASNAHDLNTIALRYFNVAGADPEGRAGQSSPHATHLIKVASEVVVGKWPVMEIYGTDYDTPDGTCVRDYIHVTDLVDAHALALSYLRAGRESQVLNCGYGRGYSVREVIEAVKQASGVDFEVREADRRLGDPPELVASAERIGSEFNWRPKFDDLQTIVSQALAWEKQLMQRQRSGDASN
ncbi:UDP-glucose 4-epimerase [bacterium MnTg02]|nr:UDP-glucose 4-epimerase [bacterium MnTg02]